MLRVKELKLNSLELWEYSVLAGLVEEFCAKCDFSFEKYLQYLNYDYYALMLGIYDGERLVGFAHGAVGNGTWLTRDIPFVCTGLYIKSAHKGLTNSFAVIRECFSRGCSFARLHGATCVLFSTLRKSDALWIKLGFKPKSVVYEGALLNA